MKNTKQNTSKIWDGVWAETTIDEQLQNLQKDDYFEHVTNLATSIQEKGRVLDAGCGLGRWVFYLKELGFDTVGVDITKFAVGKAHKYAKKERKNVDFVVADVEHLPFRTSALDLILSLGVIEHFTRSDREIIIRESHRCLKQKGTFFLTTPNKFFIAHTIWRFYYKLRREWKVGLEKSFTPKDLTHFLKTQRFKIARRKIFGFRFASTRIILFFPFLWPFVKMPSMRSYIYDVLIRLCRGSRLAGFYVCVIGIKV